MKSIRICLFIVFFFISNTDSKAQIGLPFMHNYTPKDYASETYESGNQNWAIIQDKRGVMYFGNQEGLLVYDGLKWNMLSTDNGTTVRSLAIDNDGKIYVGAIGEFGYLGADSTGKMKYISLIDKVKKEDMEFKDIWSIHVTTYGIFFRGSKNLFRWNKNQMTSYKAAGLYLSSYIIDNWLYVQEYGKGIMQFIVEKEKFILVNKGDKFSTNKIYGMFLFQDNKNLIITRELGCFLYDGIDFNPFTTEIDSFLKENFLFHCSQLSNKNYVFSTLKGGIAIIDGSGKLKMILNKSNGLQDETVLYSFVDNQNGLWLTLNYGITRVEIPSPVTRGSDEIGLKGSVQSIIRHNDILYVATSQGVFYHNSDTFTTIMPFKNQLLNFTQVEGITRQTKHLLSMGDILIAATEQGVFQIDYNKSHNIRSGSNKLFFYHKQIKDTINGKEKFIDRIYTGLIDGLEVLDYVDGNWINKGFIEGINEQIYIITEDSKENLWLGTLFQGILKVQFEEDDLKKPVIERFNEKNGLPGGWIAIYNIGGETIFSTENGLFVYDELNKKFIPHPILNKNLFGDVKIIYNLTEDSKGNIWMRIGSETRLIILKSNENNDKTYISVRTPFLRFAKMKPNVIYPETNGVTWIGIAEGIIRYDAGFEKNYFSDYSSLILKVNIDKDSSIFNGTYFDDKGLFSLTQPALLKSTLDYGSNNMIFEYCAPYFDNEKTNQFQFFLEGFDKNWSPWISETKKEYTNLPESQYKFRVRAKNIYEHISKEAVYEFNVLPPWYRTPWAFLMYTLLFVTIVYIAVRLNSRRLELANIRLQKLVDEATAEIRKQKELVEEINKDITASIRYAKRIQQSILPDQSTIFKALPNSFLLYKPKDIVSGDFYWFSNKNDSILISVVDCTGHGVPGAFMSVIGNTLLNEIVNEKGILKPDEILNNLHLGVRYALKQHEHQELGSSKDGMDLAFCSIEINNNSKDKKSTIIQYAGAYRPIFLVRNGKLIEYRGDKMPIGGEQKEERRIFTNNRIEVFEGDIVYMFTDGYVDQFGGQQDKKFMTARFKKLLVDINHEEMKKQHQILETTIDEWKGYREQVDDICVIGIKF